METGTEDNWKILSLYSIAHGVATVKEIKDYCLLHITVVLVHMVFEIDDNSITYNPLICVLKKPKPVLIS